MACLVRLNHLPSSQSSACAICLSCIATSFSACVVTCILYSVFRILYPPHAVSFRVHVVIKKRNARKYMISIVTQALVVRIEI